MIRRILSIDGGGIKGVFPASFLATVEETINDKVGNYFDLIVGTSTGGIIALGLGLDFSAKEILNLYEELGSSVFKGKKFIQTIKHFFISKYNQESLKTVLESKFGDKKLGDSSTRLVIPSLNLETGEVHVYKTAHHKRLTHDYKVKAVDVALATTAAPTFFPVHRSAVGTPLIDGGMWANNPVGFAVVEAISVLNWSRDSLKVLSLGSTTELLSVKAGRILPLGLGYWSLKLTDVFMTAQSSSSLGTAQLLTGHDNVIRISPYIGKGRFKLDKVKEIPSLKGLGHSEARKALPIIKTTFFNQPTTPFTPFY